MLKPFLGPGSSRFLVVAFGLRAQGGAESEAVTVGVPDVQHRALKAPRRAQLLQRPALDYAGSP
eukprot:14722064-Alexandrium_andersonii.AAC.1